MAVAPARIYAADEALKKNPKRLSSYVLGGIAGDARHSFGYHVDPNHLPGSDYSLQLHRDEVGARQHPHDASAWDLTFRSPAQMKLATERLLAAAKRKDPRIIRGVREFCGTRNGRDTYPYDVHGQYCEGINSWDDSHLWHVHISFYRDATAAEILAVVDVVCGVPARKSVKPAKAHRPSPRPKPTRKHPYPLKSGQYFGNIHGPAASHGGYYKSERASIAMIQRHLVKNGYVPTVRRRSWKTTKWVDGRFERETVQAVQRLQRKHHLPATGTVDRKVWELMFK